MRLSFFATLPVKLVEEVTHLVAAAPWASSVRVGRDPATGQPSVGVEWRESAPDWGIWLAHYAPAVAGVALAVAIAVAWVTGEQATPSSAVEWAQLAIAFSAWAYYTVPSKEDRQIDG